MTSFKCPFSLEPIDTINGISTFHNTFFWKDGSLHIREHDIITSGSMYECPTCGYGTSDFEEFLVI
jgi:hypothetical protein